jgi:hypothetical protein
MEPARAGGFLAQERSRYEAIPQLADPLLHRAQTEMARKRAQRIKRNPIVTYLQDARVSSPAEDQVHLARMSMLDLLCNASCAMR